MDKRDKALGELDRLPQELRLAAVEKLIKGRKQKQFIKYFVPWEEQKDALVKFTAEIKVFALLGGNRSGKSVLGAFIAVAFAFACLFCDILAPLPGLSLALQVED